MTERNNKPIYAIAGPTASGKTEIAVKLAKYVGGEVINCDSVQIYTGIHIATAKPSEEEMQGVPHHLIDYVDPNINYTAVDWAKDATECISEIESRGRIPILAGGTGFYLRALRQPFFEAEKAADDIRERLKKIGDRHGKDHLHKMLARIDAASAVEFFPNDQIRVMRALEVCFQTGKRYSEIKTDREPPPEFADRIKLFVLNPPRQQLYEKINSRTIQHFDRGLVNEVKHLVQNGVKQDRNALGAHAYRRVCEFLRGERTPESAIERSQQDVRNYAKRQITWFKREKDAVWLNGFGNDESTWEQLKELVTTDLAG